MMPVLAAPIGGAVSPTAVDALVVAGGGGGAWSGAGAGGFKEELSHAVSPGTTYPVTVGASGTASANNVNTATNGGNSVFDTITMLGGGHGVSSGNGVSGGSGSGGAGLGSTTGGAGTPGQGNAGGNGTFSNVGAGGGANSAASGTTPGTGKVSTITGLTYCVGGAATGAAAGAANTGNGGAGNAGTSGSVGGNGGSGTVVIRYADSFAPATTTGSCTYTVTGGYRIYSFTGSGSITF
jgi:hypothetical protein